MPLRPYMISTTHFCLMYPIWFQTCAYTSIYDFNSSLLSNVPYMVPNMCLYVHIWFQQLILSNVPYMVPNMCLYSIYDFNNSLLSNVPYMVPNICLYVHIWFQQLTFVWCTLYGSQHVPLRPYMISTTHFCLMYPIWFPTYAFTSIYDFNNSLLSNVPYMVPNMCLYVHIWFQQLTFV